MLSNTALQDLASVSILRPIQISVIRKPRVRSGGFFWRANIFHERLRNVLRQIIGREDGCDLIWCVTPRARLP